MAWNIPCSSEGRVALLSVTLRRGGGGKSFLLKDKGGQTLFFWKKYQNSLALPSKKNVPSLMESFCEWQSKNIIAKWDVRGPLNGRNGVLLETINLKRSLQHILSNILLIQCFLFRRRGTYLHPLTRLQQRLEKTVKAYRIFYGSFPWDFCLCLCIYMVVCLS